MIKTVQFLRIPEIRLISAVTHVDERGSFCETWNQRTLVDAGIRARFVQDNHAVSVSAGTIRGLHYQTGEYAQGKLVRVLKGRIFDVAVDIRIGSSTFGHWVGVELDAASGQQLWVPRGFAHGYCTMEADTEVMYKVDQYYNPAAEAGIRWDDPDLAISWPEIAGQPILSPKDADLPSLALADLVSSAAARLESSG